MTHHNSGKRDEILQHVKGVKKSIEALAKAANLEHLLKQPKVEFDSALETSSSKGQLPQRRVIPPLSKALFVSKESLQEKERENSLLVEAAINRQKADFILEGKTLQATSAIVHEVSSNETKISASKNVIDTNKDHVFVPTAQPRNINTASSDNMRRAVSPGTAQMIDENPWSNTHSKEYLDREKNQIISEQENKPQSQRTDFEKAIYEIEQLDEATINDQILQEVEIATRQENIFDTRNVRTSTHEEKKAGAYSSQNLNQDSMNIDPGEIKPSNQSALIANQLSDESEETEKLAENPSIEIQKQEIASKLQSCFQKEISMVKQINEEAADLLNRSLKNEEKDRQVTNPYEKYHVSLITNQASVKSGDYVKSKPVFTKLLAQQKLQNKSKQHMNECQKDRQKRKSYVDAKHKIHKATRVEVFPSQEQAPFLIIKPKVSNPFVKKDFQEDYLTMDSLQDQEQLLICGKSPLQPKKQPSDYDPEVIQNQSSIMISEEQSQVLNSQTNNEIHSMIMMRDNEFSEIQQQKLQQSSESLLLNEKKTERTDENGSTLYRVLVTDNNGNFNNVPRLTLPNDLALPDSLIQKSIFPDPSAGASPSSQIEAPLHRASTEEERKVFTVISKQRETEKVQFEPQQSFTSIEVRTVNANEVFPSQKSAEKSHKSSNPAINGIVIGKACRKVTVNAPIQYQNKIPPTLNKDLHQESILNESSLMTRNGIETDFLTSHKYSPIKRLVKKASPDKAILSPGKRLVTMQSMKANGQYVTIKNYESPEVIREMAVKEMKSENIGKQNGYIIDDFKKDTNTTDPIDPSFIANFKEDSIVQSDEILDIKLDHPSAEAKSTLVSQVLDKLENRSKGENGIDTLPSNLEAVQESGKASVRSSPRVVAISPKNLVLASSKGGYESMGELISSVDEFGRQEMLKGIFSVFDTESKNVYTKQWNPKRSKKYPRFQIFLQSEKQANLNRQTFISLNQHVIQFLADRTISSMDEPSQQRERLRSQVLASNAKKNQMTPIEVQASRSELPNYQIENDLPPEMKVDDPFNKVLMGKVIDNALLTSFRTLLKKNNTISDTLKVIHGKFTPLKTATSHMVRRAQRELYPISEVDEQQDWIERTQYNNPQVLDYERELQREIGTLIESIAENSMEHIFQSRDSVQSASPDSPETQRLAGSSFSPSKSLEQQARELSMLSQNKQDFEAKKIKMFATPAAQYKINLQPTEPTNVFISINNKTVLEEQQKIKDLKNAFSGKKAPNSYVAGKTIANSVLSAHRVSVETENDLSQIRKGEQLHAWNMTLHSDEKGSKNGSFPHSPKNTQTKYKFDPLVAKENLLSDSDDKKTGINNDLMVSKFDQQLDQRENMQQKVNVEAGFDQILQEMDYLANEQQADQEQMKYMQSPYSNESAVDAQREAEQSVKMVNEAYVGQMTSSHRSSRKGMYPTILPKSLHNKKSVGTVPRVTTVFKKSSIYQPKTRTRSENRDLFSSELTQLSDQASSGEGTLKLKAQQETRFSAINLPVHHLNDYLDEKDIPYAPLQDKKLAPKMSGNKRKNQQIQHKNSAKQIYMFQKPEVIDSAENTLNNASTERAKSPPNNTDSDEIPIDHHKIPHLTAPEVHIIRDTSSDESPRSVELLPVKTGAQVKEEEQKLHHMRISIHQHSSRELLSEVARQQHSDVIIANYAKNRIQNNPHLLQQLQKSDSISTELKSTGKRQGSPMLMSTIDRNTNEASREKMQKIQNEILTRQYASAIPTKKTEGTQMSSRMLTADEKKIAPTELPRSRVVSQYIDNLYLKEKKSAYETAFVPMNEQFQTKDVIFNLKKTKVVGKARENIMNATTDEECETAQIKMKGTTLKRQTTSKSPQREHLNEGRESLIKRQLKKLRISRGMKISELRYVYLKLFKIMDRDKDKMLNRQEFQQFMHAQYELHGVENRVNDEETEKIDQFFYMIAEGKANLSWTDVWKSISEHYVNDETYILDEIKVSQMLETKAPDAKTDGDGSSSVDLTVNESHRQ